MKKPGEFLVTKKKNQAREANRLQLKKLKEGETVEMLALGEEGLKKVTVASYVIRDNDIVICLFGKSDSRKLRIMSVIKVYDSKVEVSSGPLFGHRGVIPLKYAFGVITKIEDVFAPSKQEACQGNLPSQSE